jgi:hypothetical protein
MTATTAAVRPIPKAKAGGRAEVEGRKDLGRRAGMCLWCDWEGGGTGSLRVQQQQQQQQEQQQQQQQQQTQQSQQH